MNFIRLEPVPFTPAAVTVNKSPELVSSRTGLIKRLEPIKLQADDPQLYHYYAEIGDISRFTGQSCFIEHGGAAFSDDAARGKAMGEAIERYCGAFYWQDRFIRAPYKDLEQEAVSPEKFILFSDNQYDSASFPYSRFTKETTVNWVEGFSLVAPRKILVPANFVYVPYQFPTHEEHIASPISTGLSCGNSPVEALLSSLMEVIERDAFIITWYNRLPQPRINFAAQEFPLINYYIEQLTKANIDVHIFDITLDIPIPVYMVILVSRFSGNDVPALVVATKASLDLEHGVIGCLEEAAHTRIWARMLMREHLDPALLQSGQSLSYAEIVDNRGHVLFYSQPDAVAHLNFLLKNEKSGELRKDGSVAAGSPLEQLKKATALLADKGFEVIGVDVTTPDIMELGFYVMRVIIPGLHPLHLGYGNRYLGGNRLYQISKDLGFTSAPTTEAGINPLPHPFP